MRHPHLKELFYSDKNAYQREWRKLNPKYYKVKDEWRKLDDYIYDELPDDVVEVPDFPTYYARPNGEVWRDTRGVPSAVRTGKERILKLRSTYNSKTGYWIVQPYKNGKKKAIHLHRLILITFKGYPPFDRPECHHIDHDTSNNCIDNLMWVSRQENANYVPRHHRSKSKTTLGNGRKISDSKHRHLYTTIMELYNKGIKVKKIAETLGVEPHTISVIVYRVKNFNLLP